MKKKCLVIAANNNLITFKATLLAASQNFETEEQKVSSIVIIRTTKGENPISALEFKPLCDQVFPNYEGYLERRIESGDLYLTRLPILFRELLYSWDPEDIIVDLTNGTKSYTDFVYLACTLLGINTIFRVSIAREFYNNPDKTEGYLAVHMESILTQNQVRSFVNKTYAEYIYYYSEVRELSEWIRGLYGEHVSASFFRQMLNSFEKYASGDYQECILGLSTATEGLIDRLLNRLQNSFDSITWDWLNVKGQFSVRQYQNSNIVSLGSLSRNIGNIMTRANKIITGSTDRATQAYDEAVNNCRNQNIYKLKPIIAAGHSLQAMTVIRNYNAHDSSIDSDNATIHDARFQIDTVLFVLHKMAECELLRGEL